MREAAKENTEPDLSYLIADKEELDEFYDNWRKQMANNEAAKEAAKAASFRARKAVKQAAFNNQQKHTEDELGQELHPETQVPVAGVVLEGLPADEEAAVVEQPVEAVQQPADEEATQS